MKLFNSTAVLIFCLAASLTACGGGDGDDEVSNTGVSEDGGSDDGVSEDETSDTEGNFTVGYYNGDDIMYPPYATSEEADTLSISCFGSDETENGYVYFSCNLVDSGEIRVKCDEDGNVMETEVSGDRYLSTGCASLHYYCDEEGFGSSGVCSSWYR